jgi:hypothetical protein
LGVKLGNVELRIEELVLRGFESADHHRIGEAVERELARLFVEEGVPPSLAREGGIDRVDGGAFEAQPGSGAEAIGAHVARAVYGGLGA